MLIIPYINPVRFKPQGYTSSYNTKYFDEHLYPETLTSFEDPVTWYQPWQKSDTIVLQVRSTVNGTVTLNLISDGASTATTTASMTQVSTLVIGATTYYIYEYSLSLASIDGGVYYITITDGTDTAESNRLDICTSHPETVLVQYSSVNPYEDVIFSISNLSFYLRIPGYVRHNLPERVSTTYENQVLDTALLKAIPHNSYSYITDVSGMPTYMIDVINIAFGCPALYLDGRAFTVPDSAKWEEKEEERYPLRGWGIDLREATKKSALSISGGSPSTGSPVLPESVYDIDYDWWSTTEGEHEIGTGIVGGYRGYDISEIYRPIWVARDRRHYKLVDDSTPGLDEVYWNSVDKKFVFNSTQPFVADPDTGITETVSACFEVE